jgi:molybdate transport system ATP-binding protein
MNRRSADLRPIGMVFQDYLLFDHLSALENVAFGLRARAVHKRAARRRAAAAGNSPTRCQYNVARPR